MKHMRKILALLVVAAMFAAMGVSALADTETLKGNGDFSVTINPNDSATTHAYKAYQIFAGDLVEKTGATTGNPVANLTLSNIVWGDGVDGDALLTELHTLSGTSGHALYGLFPDTVDSAAKVADVLDEKADDSTIAQAFAEAVQNHLATAAGTGSATGVTGLEAGYYFIQDEGTFTSEEPGAYTRYILQVVHSVSITAKASIPEVTKEVTDKNDSTGTTETGKTVADYDIGDSVPFKFTGTLPSNFLDYDQYLTYTFSDTLSNGLTPPAADAITIKLNGTSDIKSHFDVDVTGQNITISLKSGEDMLDIASAATDTIVVEYSAVLNENAEKGNTGNENKVNLTFSNDPNADGSGKTDTTPDSTVIVFTYDFVTNKVDEDGNALEGATFALYKKYHTSADMPSGKTAVTSVTYDEGRKTYTFTAEDDEVWAQVDEITGVTTFTFAGIDDGDYVLVETGTPAGYNSIDPVAFTVTPTLDGTTKTITAINGETNNGTVNLGTLEATVGLNDTTSSLTTDVENKSGVILPSTGGIGTTIFYVVGGILVAGAGVILITKRRLLKEQ